MNKYSLCVVISSNLPPSAIFRGLCCPYPRARPLRAIHAPALPFFMYLQEHSRLARGLCVARALFARGSRLCVARFQLFFIVSVCSVALPPPRSARALLPSRAKCLPSWVLWAHKLPLSKTGVFSLTNSP